MPRRNVSYVKPSEPAFLKRLKEEVGFKEGPTIETKRERLPTQEDDDGDAKDDEQPVVVVLKPGDLTEEEASEFLSTLNDESDPKEEKITFRKPEKREMVDAGNLSSTKKLKVQQRKTKKVESESKKVKNKCLLSFNDEEHDDD